MTIKIDLMELADLGEPIKLATAIIDQNPDLPIPVPIEEIAYALKITDIRELETEGYEGGLIAFAEKSEGVILINKNSKHHRQRFTIGHEIGHFVCPWHRPADGKQFLCSSRDMSYTKDQPSDRAIQMEVDANKFSAELLFPKRVFRKDLRRFAGVDIEQILSLADRYDMSKEATARRYVDLNEEPCAVVISHNGTFLRCYRERTFPFISLSKGQPLPSQSLSARSAAPIGTVTEWEEVDAGVWTDVRHGSRSRTMIEQTFAQQNGYRISLLALEDTDEDDDEEDELEESWTPHFHRR